MHSWNLDSEADPFKMPYAMNAGTAVQVPQLSHAAIPEAISRTSQRPKFRIAFLSLRFISSFMRLRGIGHMYQSSCLNSFAASFPDRR